jgi:DNA-binding HxlR family transcriptional regulator
MGIRTDLLVTEEIAESSDLRATPFEFERAKRVEAALSVLEGKWKIVILNRLFARAIWRFSALERAVPGISQRMLSQQLVSAVRVVLGWRSHLSFTRGLNHDE